MSMVYALPKCGRRSRKSDSNVNPWHTSFWQITAQGAANEQHIFYRELSICIPPKR
jgi:hypothetical protein